jgi:hypothetical protein
MERAERLEAMIERRISGLRRRRLRVIGLAPGAPRLPPTSIGGGRMRIGPASGLRAILTRSPVLMDDLTLEYGDLFDVTAPLAEVTTIFHGYSWFSGTAPSDRPESAWALGRAERRDDAIASGAWSALSTHQESEPDGPFMHGTTDIIVFGTRRTVPVVSYRHYQALSFSEGATGVTVLSRHPLPGLPQFNWVTDLEPYLAAWSRQMREIAERTGPLTA